MMNICNRLLFCLALWCGACGAGHAETVRYGFNGAVWDAAGGTGYLPFRFEFDWPGFISADTTVPAGAMRTCQVDGAFCDSARFFMDSKASGYSPESLNAMLFGIYYPEGNSADSAYYFPLGTFGSFGTFAADGNPGTLTISAVPEPAAWLAWLAGLAVLALARRRAPVAGLPFLQRNSAQGGETGKMSALSPYPLRFAESHHDDHRSRRNQRRRHQSQSDREGHPDDAAIPAHQGRLSDHAGVLPHGRLLRTVP
jgi:hypothetical protein